MTDSLTPEGRSANMRRIRSKDTKPECIVRSIVHQMGFRYRLHAPDLPGKPDITLRSRRKVIFIHGCFWHLHNDCSEGRIPASRREYWLPKLERNRERDASQVARLKEDGWKVLVVWECEISNMPKLKRKLQRFLGKKLH
jgi:DNA mismatch endonuclease (patch repair protein)